MTISFRVKLLASHAVVALAVSAVTLVLVERSVSRRMEQQVDRRLEAQAKAVARWLTRARHPDRLAGRLAGVVGARVTILDNRGVAVGESGDGSISDRGLDDDGNDAGAGRESDAAGETVAESDLATAGLDGGLGAAMDKRESGDHDAADFPTMTETGADNTGKTDDNLGSAAEIQGARSNSIGRDTRYSATDGAHVRYVAVAAPRDYVVRLGLPIGEIDDTKRHLRNQLGVAALTSMLVAFALAALVAGPLTRQLRSATALARRIVVGDYRPPEPSSAQDDVGVLYQTLASAAAQLRENENKRREFLATVAHEIRTPVTSIRGYAQTLSAPDVPAEDRDEFVQTIHRNAVRIGQLVEDLLELEALQAGKSRALASDNVSVAPVVGHVVQTLRGQAEENNAQVTTSVTSDICVAGDSDAIERILLNLTSNALRHGGHGVMVAIDSRQVGGTVHIRVHDTGRGIPADQRRHIFERFYRGDAAADTNRRGTGLGLAIARELARAMGGDLEVSDNQTGDKGTTFLLWLKAANAAPNQRDNAATPRS